MSHTLIQVGNSKALIIPAKIIKKKNYDLNTEFDIIETKDGFNIVHKKNSIDSMKFPKVSKPKISKEINAISGVAEFTPEEIQADERLKYILEK